MKNAKVYGIRFFEADRDDNGNYWQRYEIFPKYVDRFNPKTMQQLSFKRFYTAEEAAEKLGSTPDEMKAAIDKILAEVVDTLLYMDLNIVPCDRDFCEGLEELIKDGDYRRWEAELYEYNSEAEYDEDVDWKKEPMYTTSWYYDNDYYQMQLESYRKKNTTKA